MNLNDIVINEQPPKQHSVEQLQLTPGIWVEGKYYWMQTCLEKVIYDEGIVLKVKQEQVHSKIRLSNIFVSNYSKQEREIKILVMHHYPNPTHEQLTFVSPTDNRIFHLANKKVYMVNAHYDGAGIKEYTTGPQWNVFTNQLWSSIKKGTLKYQPMAKGLAASVFNIKLMLGPHETEKISTWAITGDSKNEVLLLEQALLKNTLAFPFEK